jgi:glycosyltransferase involved in cell wall biosynthesis
MARHKLLLVSCYFPPAGGIQVQRALSISRYLPPNGFEVFVLTARAAVPASDPELVKLIPEDVEVHRTWTLEPPFYMRKKLWSRVSKPATSSKAGSEFVTGIKSILTRKIKQLLSPDPQILWYPFAVRRASKLIRRKGIQTILVTAPPFSSFLIATTLKRRFPELHLIADIRDEWIEYILKEFGFRDADMAARAAQIERAMVESCDRIVNVSATSLQSIRSRYPKQPSEKFALIPNGYDPASFSTFRSRPHNTGRLVITYVGTIYKPSSPKAFLDALDGLAELCPAFETRFVGRVAEEFDRSIFERRHSLLRFTGFVPQKEAIRFMEEADILLLSWADRFNIPGKLFEYLATGKPILALCPPGSDVEHIIRGTASGWYVDTEDRVAIQRVLTEIHALQGKFPQNRNWEAIRRYERPNLVAEYAQLIRDCDPTK